MNAVSRSVISVTTDLEVTSLKTYKISWIESELNKSKFGSYCSSPKTMFITKDFITWVYTCPDIQLRTELQTLNTSNF